MAEDDEPTDVSKADYYRHSDGTIEVVYAVCGDVVLTVREYERRSDFGDAIGDAEFVGKHDGVAELPDPESIRETEFGP